MIEFTEKDRDYIVDNYLSGKGTQEISEKFGCNRKTISSFLKRNGIEVRPKILKKLCTPEELSQISILCHNQSSLREIGKVIGVKNIETIKSIIADQLGIKYESPVFNKGYRTISCEGYVRIMIDENDKYFSMAGANTYVLEHRYVMAKYLGRCLYDYETVHHIDGDRSNNSIGNLQLRHGAHGPGQIVKCNSCGSIDIVYVKIEGKQ